jgi:hypothetical protein
VLYCRGRFFVKVLLKSPKGTRSIPRAHPVQLTHLQVIDPAGLPCSHKPEEKAQSQNDWLEPWQRNF